FFVPLLVGTGGNTGAQAATLVLRAMAVGEVRLGDLARVVLREVRRGLLLGTARGVLAFPALALAYDVPIAAVVPLTRARVAASASLAGGMLPLIARRVGIDPALVSSPLIATLVDATGLVLYFVTAYAVLGDRLS